MAWNEPGGNSNNQDPWGGGGGGRRGGDQKGPPDLDEAFRKLQDSLNGMFGGKKRGSGGGSGGGSRRGGFGLVWVSLVVLLAVWLFNAIYIVDEQEQAVVLRFGKYHETVGPGLNLYFPPIDRKFQENVTRERSYSKQGQMLTEDENIIEVPLTVQYKISDLQSFVLNVDQPEISLQHATDSAVRHVVGSTAMDQVLTEGREAMAGEVKERLQRFLDNYGTGITVTQVNLQSAAAPREVQEAFDDVIRAREDEQREKNQAESYANGVIPEARGQAQRMLEEASGYRDAVISRAEGEADRFTKLLTEYSKAPEVTRERLYLETMQEVMSNTSKVMVTGESGQNNLLYLPLDKMINGRGTASSNAASAGTASGAASQSTRLPPELDPREVRTRESR
ncbi:MULTISPECIES: FtsH protease activity modulator HflK [Stutzerimonas stutzeri group]|uniref:FtsH protease activity modulator HflK n=1 Tax=Stutzerimonas stutzeri group TaxID=136846 RepID=UPI0012D98F42|nr:MULTISPECIES: FtsH protease activity modulator HflK [Stutzerimonas stutzeri group]MCF6751280.1 FtsH protease activity modulator HflK [Stutzerimonas stutzeri]MTZ12995.1 FtsH protease activity modulator HflK [Stutzerimonas degradans]NHC08829.1 FtsH protease activity modulator HflK [Stutzerimonas degradans]NHW00986.1 FtsH protease activity modulator HflK [Stutzerimonas degradans]UVO17595.1 FtsH protease activity modulator HflK [Stutzerimonas stutzeri]